MTEEIRKELDNQATAVAEAPEAPADGLPETPVDGSHYEGEDVDVLRDAAHIRQRPGMYIGDTATKGLHHLVYELVYNSVDEALAGYAKTIQVKIHADGSLSVADDGRGIPVDTHPKTGRPTLEVVMTMVGAGAKFGKGTYKISAGLHGIGAKAVTALSEWTQAEVRRNGKVYVQEYERGHPITEVKEMGVSSKRTGTKITFMPDPQVFRDAKFDYDTLESRLRELAFLNKGLRIELEDERDGKKETFHYAGGVAEFVEHLNKSEETLHKPIYMEKTVDAVYVEVALQYTTSEQEQTRAYANNAYNPGGGTHMSGFRAALTRALNSYGAKETMFKNVNPIGEDFREGLTAIISVQVPEPQFESQTKVKLNNPEVEGIVTSVINEHLSKYLEENPKDAQKIMRKVVLAAEAREAASKAKKALRERKNILSGGGLPGKLMDCTSRDRDESELFLVEGQSAGGSAESGRNREYQAVLPLRGKVLNVEKARVEKVLGNEEIRNLISAVGVDIGETEDMSGRRYGKVILLTDADVDGQHIRTLLLTFFYRQMRKLIEDGHVYVARPPLYKVTEKKHVRFIQKAEEMDVELMRRGLEGAKLQVTPVLNEITGEQGPTRVLDGERLARLVQVLGDLQRHLAVLERRGINLGTIFQTATERGLPGFRVLLGGHPHWFWTRAEVEAFLEEQKQKLGHDLEVGDEMRGGNGNGNGHPAETLFAQELHEVREINRGLEQLREFGLGTADLLPLPRIAGREPPVRYVLDARETHKSLAHVRDLASEVRKFGEKGLVITRFKGLGEMDADELWETTLDPDKRAVFQVKLEDALKAEEMFRTLMGEKVEPRREFIQKHAREVTDIDYHGA
jgi:DNA gyrase subunit B